MVFYFQVVLVLVLSFNKSTTYFTNWNMPSFGVIELMHDSFKTFVNVKQNIQLQVTLCQKSWKLKLMAVFLLCYLLLQD